MKKKKIKMPSQKRTKAKTIEARDLPKYCNFFLFVFLFTFFFVDINCNLIVLFSDDFRPSCSIPRIHPFGPITEFHCFFHLGFFLFSLFLRKIKVKIIPFFRYWGGGGGLAASVSVSRVLAFCSGLSLCFWPFTDLYLFFFPSHFFTIIFYCVYVRTLFVLFVSLKERKQKYWEREDNGGELEITRDEEEEQSRDVTKKKKRK